MTDTERRDGRISPPPLSPAREPLALGAFITGPGLGDSNGSLVVTPVRDGFSPRARMINKDKENDREKDKEKINPSREEKKKRKKLQKELGKLKKQDKDKKKKRKGDKEKDKEKEKEKEPRRTIVLPPLEDSNGNGLSDPDVKRVVNPVYGMGARVKKLNLRYNATASPASSPRDDTPIVIISMPEKNGHDAPDSDNSSPRKGVSFNDTPITFVPKDPPPESIVKGLSRSDDNSWKRQALLNKGVVVRSPAASPSASPKVSTALSSSDDNHMSRIRRSLTAGPSTSSSSPSLPSLQEILGDESSKDNGATGGDLKVKGNAERRASSLNSEAGRISSGRPKSMNVNTTLAGIEVPRRVEKKKDGNWKMRALTGKGVMAESSEKYNEPFSRLSVLMSIVDIPKTERESLLSGGAGGSPTTPSTHNNHNNAIPEVSQRLPRTTPSTTAYLLDGKRTWNGLPGKGRHIKLPTKKIPQTPRGTSSTTTTTTTSATTFNAQRLKTVKTVASEAVQELMEELEAKKKELREVDVTITEEEVGEFLSRVDEIIAFLKSED